jgi:hypothetical protein
VPTVQNPDTRDDELLVACAIDPILLTRMLQLELKRSKLKGLNSISIAGSDNSLVELEYKGKQSNVILTI